MALVDHVDVKCVSFHFCLFFLVLLPLKSGKSPFFILTKERINITKLYILAVLFNVAYPQFKTFSFKKEIGRRHYSYLPLCFEQTFTVRCCCGFCPYEPRRTLFSSKEHHRLYVFFTSNGGHIINAYLDPGTNHFYHLF